MNFFLKIAVFLLHAALVVAASDDMTETMITQFKTKYPECYRYFWDGIEKSKPHTILKLTSEVLFHAEGSDFARLVDKMTYIDIYELEPSKILSQLDGPTEIGEALRDLLKKLKLPSKPDHASLAVNMAARILYINRVGLETYRGEAEDFSETPII
jgi:hypothetical protein